jgi:segregation and condensation protein B
MNKELEKKLEAILFFKGEPISFKKLLVILETNKEELREALSSLRESLQERGIVLIENDDKYTLGTHSQFSDMIEKLQKEELNKDLSKANLEVLSIILYKNGATRGEIDFIRGVNSSFTLRALGVRGLIDKEVHKEDSRKFVYKPSMELLNFMGVSRIEDLDNYEEIQNNLNNLNINSSNESRNNEE